MKDDIVAVLVEPREGHTDEEESDELRKLGATGIEIVAKGFIWAELSKSKFKSIEPVAYVRIKPKHNPL